MVPDRVMFKEGGNRETKAQPHLICLCMGPWQDLTLPCCCCCCYMTKMTLKLRPTFETELNLISYRVGEILTFKPSFFLLYLTTTLRSAGLELRDKMAEMKMHIQRQIPIQRQGQRHLQIEMQVQLQMHLLGNDESRHHLDAPGRVELLFTKELVATLVSCGWTQYFNNVCGLVLALLEPLTLLT